MCPYVRVQTPMSLCAHMCVRACTVSAHTHPCSSTLVQGSQQEEGSAFNHGMCRAVGQGLGLGEECLPGGGAHGQDGASRRPRQGLREGPGRQKAGSTLGAGDWCCGSPGLAHACSPQPHPAPRPPLGVKLYKPGTTGEGPGGGSWPRCRGPARLRVTLLQRCSWGDCLPGAAGPLSGPCVPISQPGSLRRPSPPAHLGVPRTVAN